MEEIVIGSVNLYRPLLCSGEGDVLGELESLVVDLLSMSESALVETGSARKIPVMPNYLVRA